MSPSTSKPQDAMKLVREPKSPAKSSPSGRRREIVDVPMFDLSETPPPVKGKRFPGPRTIRQVRCPGGEHRAGLISGTAEHLVWRTHQVRTASGASYPCPASGRCLCQVPAPDTAGIHTPTCDDHGPWSA